MQVCTAEHTARQGERECALSPLWSSESERNGLVQCHSSSCALMTSYTLRHTHTDALHTCYTAATAPTPLWSVLLLLGSLALTMVAVETVRTLLRADAR